MPPGLADFTRLYRRQAKALLVFFERRVRDPELATDLMAETFTVALEHRHQIRGSTDDELSGWLWSIAQSVLRDHERQAATERRGRPRLGVERRALTDAELERIDDLGAIARLGPDVMRHLDRLPVDARTAVRMRFLDDRSYTDIAAALELSPSGARTLVSRALRQLAAQLRVRRDEELR